MFTTKRPGVGEGVCFWGSNVPGLDLEQWERNSLDKYTWYYPGPGSSRWIPFRGEATLHPKCRTHSSYFYPKTFVDVSGRQGNVFILLILLPITESIQFYLTLDLELQLPSSYFSTLLVMDMGRRCLRYKNL